MTQDWEPFADAIVNAGNPEDLLQVGSGNCAVFLIIVVIIVMSKQTPPTPLQPKKKKVHGIFQILYYMQKEVQMIFS